MSTFVAPASAFAIIHFPSVKALSTFANAAVDAPAPAVDVPAPADIAPAPADVNACLGKCSFYQALSSSSVSSAGGSSPAGFPGLRKPPPVPPLSPVSPVVISGSLTG